MTRAPQPGCVFCAIIAGRSPAEIWHEDESLIVFFNKLRWLRVQLLIVPKEHKTQAEFWREDMERAAALAVELGEEHAPGGFRLVSNFGIDGEQSQPHAHLHLLGGRHLGLYIEDPPFPPSWQRHA